eukprot:8052443-Lingulodinium_polyedra.AAC.1
MASAAVVTVPGSLTNLVSPLSSSCPPGARKQVVFSPQITSCCQDAHIRHIGTDQTDELCTA